MVAANQKKQLEAKKGNQGLFLLLLILFLLGGAWGPGEKQVGLCGGGGVRCENSAAGQARAD
eukprot:5636241-Pyramimonas_sp.AAC.1